MTAKKKLVKQRRHRSSEEAVWSESSLFAMLTTILWIPSLETSNLFDNRMREVLKILGHLP